MRLFLALGSNLGDRIEYLRFARSEALRSIYSGPVESASLYESAPIDCPEGSGPFLNTVIAGPTGLPPDRILASAQAIEAAAGRSRTGVRNAPRTLDLDILLLGDQVIRSDALTIPHPRLHRRRFVLQPLAELAPHLVIPGLAASVCELCDSLTEAEPLRVRLASCW